MQWVWIWLLIISCVAILVTIGDKLAAQRGAWRTSERALLTLAFLGGALAMLIAMRLIRHKTRHPKFMIGLPIIIIAQAVLLYFVGQAI